MDSNTSMVSNAKSTTSQLSNNNDEYEKGVFALAELYKQQQMVRYLDKEGNL
jgi:hypothetical protein